MNIDEFKREFESALYTALNVHKQRSPYKTGNLRENAIKILKSPNGYKIWVDTTIAPYALELDSKASIKERYPEGWFDHICYKIVDELMKKYDKKQYKSEEYQEGMGDLESVRRFYKSDRAMREWNRKYNTPIIVGNPAKDKQK